MTTHFTTFGTHNHTTNRTDMSSKRRRKLEWHSTLHMVWNTPSEDGSVTPTGTLTPMDRLCVEKANRVWHDTVLWTLHPGGIENAPDGVDVRMMTNTEFPDELLDDIDWHAKKNATLESSKSLGMAHVADIARLYIIYAHGGTASDTDCVWIKPFPLPSRQVPDLLLTTMASKASGSFRARTGIAAGKTFLKPRGNHSEHDMISNGTYRAPPGHFLIREIFECIRTNLTSNKDLVRDKKRFCTMMSIMQTLVILHRKKIDRSILPYCACLPMLYFAKDLFKKKADAVVHRTVYGRVSLDVEEILEHSFCVHLYRAGEEIPADDTGIMHILSASCTV